MLVPETNVFVSNQGHHSNDILVRIINSDGETHLVYFSGDTLIEDVKNKSIKHFYPNGEQGNGRFKIVRVVSTTTLHDFLTLDQENVCPYEELLLVERRGPEAITLWALGSLRAPHPNRIIAATADLPPPQNSVRQPHLQSLLSTNELTFELRKILISLIEAGARLAAAGNNFELSLGELIAAFDEPITQPLPEVTEEIITAEALAFRLNIEAERNFTEVTCLENSNNGNPLKRAECLQQFLSKFQEWRLSIIESPNSEDANILAQLGFTEEEVNSTLRDTGNNMSAAASYLIGERGSSVFEILHGLPDGYILQTLLKQPQIQRGLLNTRMLKAFIAIVKKTGNSNLWINSPNGNSILSHITRTYHSEKYCMAVNQFSLRTDKSQPVADPTSNPGPSTSSY